MRPINGLTNGIAVVFSDVDGVWTDGGMYYGEHGDTLRKFNTRDSGGVLLLREACIPLCVLSGERSKAVEKRLRKLQVQHFFLGVERKLDIAMDFCSRYGLDLGRAAFIGDDWNDIPLVEHVAFAACPADASRIALGKCHLVLNSRGGEGAFREFVERLLEQRGDLDLILRRVVERL